jgi:radical SAM protein with 4Fe4S-binding SPASM domain
MHVKELVFGKAGEDNIEQVWRSHPVLVEIRQGVARRLAGVCGRCIMKEMCRGACMAQYYYASGSVWGPYWFCHGAERAGLFPVGRLAELNDRPDCGSYQEGKT